MIDKSLKVSVAESCTGGFLSTFFTSKAGSSMFFNGSITTYSNDSKNQLLSIPKEDINVYGVVSDEVVQKMANNVRKKFNTDYGLATTGYVDSSGLDFQSTNMILYAWIAVANKDRVISKCVFLNHNRLQNISRVSYELLNLFRKEII